MSQYQRSPYREQFTPEIDHRQAVMIALSNVLNAFQAPEMESESRNIPQAGISQFFSGAKVTLTRFTYCFALLDGLIEEDKPKEFKDEKPSSVVQLFQDMEKKPGEPSASKWFTYWNRIDKLLREQGFYTTSKLPSGHL